MEVSGIIKRIPFYKPETGYGVFNIGSDIVTGCAANAAIGKRLTAKGTKIYHPVYGEQIKSDTITIEDPTDEDSLVKMLANANIPTIGKSSAGKLVKYFGVDVLKHLNDAEALHHAGMTDKQIPHLIEYHKKARNNAEVLALLGRAGLGVKTTQLLSEYSIAELQKPYELLGLVPRLSFDNVDRIFKTLCGDNNNEHRIKAGISEVLRKTQDAGNSGMSRDAVISKACSLLLVQADTVSRVLVDNLGDAFMQDAHGIVFTRETHDTETKIASYLKAMTHGVQYKNIPEMPKLSNEQGAAIHNAANFNVSIVTGAPGTGKTTVIKTLCELAKLNNIEAYLIAPTAMAANKMSDDAETIHLFVKHKSVNKNSLVIVDECSMLSTELLLKLLKKIKHARVVFVGDVDQLPSIDYGQVLKDLIDSQQFPVTRLTEVFRFGDAISQLAREVLLGVVPNISNDTDNPCSIILCDSDEEIADTVISLATRYNEVQVLSPVKKGDCGTAILNNRLSQVFNAEAKRCDYLGVGVGDRVVNTKNNYELNILNGSLGTVIAIDGHYLTVDYDDTGCVTVEKEKATVQLAYALTVHKAQGQEYQTVILALGYSAPFMLQRRLVYTAITRGSDKVIIACSKKVLETIAYSGFDSARVTGLTTKLK